MSGDKVLVKTMRQVSNADSDLILEKQNDIPSISEIIAIFLKHLYTKILYYTEIDKFAFYLYI